RGRRKNVRGFPARGQLKKMDQRVRRWRIHTPTRHDLGELAALINPVVAGWMNCTYLMRWAGKKYRQIRPHKRFKAWWTELLDREPGLFMHWAWARTLAGMR
ncbi:group II intron maturase-specific domain-containing protein, partial [Candidatus Frankia alpina]|uniref:group II intron maturase-specific domain-containing protein n=1 Tax=Candidatus Frankia alpina TaxID=2699483 RepID=UPI0023509500